MGHRKYAGHVSEHHIAGGAFVRVDVPETEQPAGFGREAYTTPAYTKQTGVSSIYMITPCTEDVARRAAQSIEEYHQTIPVALPPAQHPLGSSSAAEEVEADVEAGLDNFDRIE